MSIFTRQEVEEARKWAEESVRVYDLIGEGDWTLQDVKGRKGLGRLIALARSYEQLHEAAEYVRDASLITADDAMLTDALEKLDTFLSVGENK